jgi:hypothetical protein
VYGAVPPETLEVAVPLQGPHPVGVALAVTWIPVVIPHCGFIEPIQLSLAALLAAPGVSSVPTLPEVQFAWSEWLLPVLFVIEKTLLPADPEK